MNSRRWCNPVAQRTAALLLAVPALFGTAAGAQTLTSPLGTPSATQTASVTLPNGGLVNSIVVVTQGSTTLDFTLASSNQGSCKTGLAGTYTPGATCTVQYVFTPTRPFTRYGAVILYDALGNVLGNTFLTGIGIGAQVGYPLGASSTVTALGSGFMNPGGVAVDAAGNVYVADTQNNAVKEIPAGGGTPVTLGSGFRAPTGVAVDGAGNVYVADTGNSLVKEIVVTNGSAPVATPPVIQTLASTTTFVTPQAIAVDGNGDVFVADKGKPAVYEILASNGTIPTSPTVNTLPGTFTMPSGVAVDAAGNVYIADSANAGIVEIPTNGSGNVTLGSGLTAPQGVAVDGPGNVYVASTGAVTEFLAANGVVPSGTTVATAVALGSGFTTPTGVAVDSTGNVYVADTASTASIAELAQTAPSLTFGSSAVGVQSADSPKSVSFQNIGNAALSIPVLPTGTSPVLSAGFVLDSGTGTTCPVVSASATAPGSLPAGSTCAYGVDFKPATTGSPVTGTLTLTSNNGGASTNANSIFNLSGTATPGTPGVTVLPASIPAGSSSVTLSASVTFGGAVPTGQFTFTVNPNTATASSSMGTCSGTSSPLSCSTTYNPSGLAVGNYTIQGSIAADANYITNSNTAQLTVTQGTPTVTLTTSRSSSTVDSPVTFTASVTPNTGVTPTGSVTFMTSRNGGSSSTIAGCSSLPLSGGQATCTTGALLAGSNAITASLTADTNFASATSTAVTDTVTAAATTLALSSSPSPSTVDVAVTLTATLSPAQNAPAFVVSPTGTVSFTSNGAAIPGCSGSLVTTTNGVTSATCIAYALIAPSNVLSAVYTSGDSNFTGSTASGTTQVVGKATPVNTVSSNQTTASVNQPVTFSALITPPNNSTNGVTPTGSVTFTTGATQLCQPVVVTAGPNGTGTASCQTTFPVASAQSVTITATYSGDSNFTAGNVPTFQQGLSTTSTTIPATSITTSPSSPTVNASVTLTASIVPAFTGSTTPSGTIVFTDSVTGSQVSCPVANGVVGSCQYTFTRAGTHTLTAAYSGDSNFGASTGSNTVTVVSSGALTINLTTSKSPVTVNQTATYSAAFNPAGGPTYPAGSVQYFDGTTALTGTGCNAPVSGNGTISSCTETLNSVGNHVITATFTSSNSDFNTFTAGGLTEQVLQNTTATALTSPSAPSSVDQTVTFSANVTPTALTGLGSSGTVAPTGTITFTYNLNGNNVTLCNPSVSTQNGVTLASCTAALPTAGTYSLTAVYSGDSNFGASTSTAYAQKVGQSGTTLTSSAFSTPASPAVNQATTLSVQLSLSSNATGPTTPSGNITFKDSANGLSCSAQVTTSGQASCTLAEPTSGNHIIVATYAGDTNFTGTSSNFSFTVIASGVTIAASSIYANPSTPTVNQSAALNVTLTPNNTGSAQPSGSVKFTDTLPNNTVVTACPATPVSNGVVTSCSYTFTTSGLHTITATYSGDSNFSTVTQSNSIQVGAVGSLAIALSYVPPSGAATGSAPTVNQAATFSATFSPAPSGPATPAGSVQYFDGGTAIVGCNVQVSGTGTIPTCTETLLTAGQHNITASFTSSNTATFPNSTSNSLPQPVNKSSTQTMLTLSSSPSTVDQPVTFNATVTLGALTPAGIGNTLPSGSIAFTATNTTTGVATALCTQSVSTSSPVTASCSVPFLLAGSYTVTATYAGDSNFLTSTSTNFPQTVGKTSTAVMLVPGSTLANPSSPAANQTATYTVQVTPSVTDTGLTLPSGNVIFTDSTPSPAVSCTAVVVASTGQASCSFSTTGNGAHTITAAYTGDNNFSNSSTPFSIQVILAAPTLTITTPPASPTINATGFSFNATLVPPAGSTGIPTGRVTFTDSVAGSTPCTVTLNSGNVPPCSFTFSTAGNHTINASYSGDTSFSATTATPITILVLQATPGITLVSSLPLGSLANQSVTFSATIIPSPAAISSLGTPTGTITFTFPAGSTTSTTCAAPVALNASGAANCTATFGTYPPIGNGIDTVTASYSGDTNYTTTQKSITQNVASYIPNLSPQALQFGQGDSNNTDPYSTGRSITYSLTPQNGFSDNTTTTCTTPLSTLQCNVPSTFALGSTTSVVVTAGNSVPAGTYNLAVVTTDNTNSGLRLSTPLTVTVIGRVFPAGSSVPYSVPTSGQVSIPFSLPTTLAGSSYSCNPNVANVGANGTYSQNGDTLSSLGLTCTVAGSGTSYTVTITAGSGGATTASLRSGEGFAERSGLLAAGLFAPFLLLLGARRNRAHLSRALVRSVCLALVTVTALYSTGCSSGGFSRGNNTTYAVGGSYLISITNASGTSVTEVPLLVTGNGAGI